MSAPHCPLLPALRKANPPTRACLPSALHRRVGGETERSALPMPSEFDATSSASTGRVAVLPPHQRLAPHRVIACTDCPMPWVGALSSNRRTTSSPDEGHQVTGERMGHWSCRGTVRELRLQPGPPCASRHTTSPPTLPCSANRKWVPPSRPTGRLSAPPVRCLASWLPGRS